MVNHQLSAARLRSAAADEAAVVADLGYARSEN
jgi:hypothetical protein